MIPLNTIDINNDLILRKVMPMDAEDIFNTIDSERDYLGRWLPFVAQTTDISNTVSFLNSILEAEDKKNVCVYTIRYQDSFAGIVGFKATDFDNHKTEIGYWLGQKFQHKGLMSQSVKTLCDKAFAEMDINRIQIKCAVGNTRSSNIPKRLGFKLEGIERDGELLSSGHFTDLETYSLLKSDKPIPHHAVKH